MTDVQRGATFNNQLAGAWNHRKSDDDVLVHCINRGEVALAVHQDHLDEFLGITDSQSHRGEIDQCRGQGFAPLLTITPTSRRVTRWAVPPGAQPPNSTSNGIAFGTNLTKAS